MMRLDDAGLRERANKFAWDFCGNEHHWDEPCYDCSHMTDALVARDIALLDAARVEAFEEVCGRLLFDLPGKGLAKLWNAAQIPTPGEPLDHADLIAKAVVKAARAEQRLDDMIAMCNRCAGDPRGPGQHEIEKCAAAAIRAQEANRE